MKKEQPVPRGTKLELRNMLKKHVAQNAQNFSMGKSAN